MTRVLRLGLGVEQQLLQLLGSMPAPGAVCLWALKVGGSQAGVAAQVGRLRQGGGGMRLSPGRGHAAPGS
jgi:hypothetical protein